MHQLYNYAWFFIIYAFLGWCGEVAFAAIKTGTFVNRGLLNGPVCPIYGAGVCIVVLCLSPISANIAALFIGSVILTSVLEFLTGFVLEKLYKEKWWDYSERPFNIKGYICLEFSLLWGAACVIVVRLIHPLILKLVGFVPMTLGIILLSAAAAAYIADSAVTFVVMHKFRVSARVLEKVVTELKEVSDGLGEKIFESVIGAKEHSEALMDDLGGLRENAERITSGISEYAEQNIGKLSEKRQAAAEKFAAKLEELKPMLQKNSDVGRRTRRRLVKAFPNLKATKQHRTFELTRKLKEKLNERKSA